MVPRPQSSAAGVLALLAEQAPLLKQHALKTLISLVPQFWAEISEHIAIMYVLDIHPNIYVSHRNTAKLFMKAQIYLSKRVTQPPFSPAKCITISKNTTKP